MSLRSLFSTAGLALLMTTVSAQRISTIIGGNGDGGPATAAQIFSASSLTVATNGDIYFGDAGTHTIRKVSAGSGIISVVAGDGREAGIAFPMGALEASLLKPGGLCFDALGNIIFADAGWHAILKLEVATATIHKIAGLNNEGFSGDGNPAISATLNEPMSPVVDGAGNIYFVDRKNHRIRKVTIATGIITTIAGTGAGFEGDGLQATAAKLFFPEAMTIGPDGNIYVADTQNQRIRKIVVSTGIITTIAGNGNPGYSGDGAAATAAAMYNPGGLAFDDDGNLLVSDRYNNRVRKIDLTTTFISTVAGTGTFGSTGDGSSPLAANIAGVDAVAVGPGGEAYLLETFHPTEKLFQKIRKFTNTVISTVVGRGMDIGDGGQASAAALSGPTNIVYGPDGNLYINERASRRVRKVDTNTGVITTVAGGGTGGYPFGALATATDLYGPTWIGFDGDENLLIADPPNGWLFKVDNVSGIITTIAGVLNTVDGPDGGLAVSTGIRPEAFDVDDDGNIYIACYNAHKVKKITASTGIITTIAGTGTLGYDGVGGQGTAAQLAHPTTASLDGAGNLYISEMSRILKLNLSTGVITLYAGGGTGFENVPPASANLFKPGAVIHDQDGNAYFPEATRIRRVNASNNLMSTYAGSSSGGYSGDGGAAHLATLGNDLKSIILDPDGNILIADFANNRIRKITMPVAQAITFSTLPAGVVGQQLEVTAGMASSTSGLPVTFSSSNVNVVKVFNNYIIPVGAGTAIITANQAGDPDYLPATPVTQSITISKGTPVIAVSSPSSGPAGETFILYANKGGSTGNASFSVANGTGTASISAGSLTMLTPGTVTVQLDIASDANYNAANVSHLVTISKASPKIFFTSPVNGLVGSTIELSVDKGGSTGSVSFSVTAETGTATLTGSTLTLTGAGVVRVSASITADATYETKAIADFVTIHSSNDPTPGSAQVWGVMAQNGPGRGTLVRMNPDGTGLISQHAFITGETGAQPFVAQPVAGADGKIYGTLQSGGKYNAGVLFSFDPANGAYVVRHHFQSINGGGPSGKLFQSAGGKFYGVTGGGGANGNGVIFEFDPTNNALTKKFDFAFSTSGHNAQTGLTLASDGFLYGVTNGGGTGSAGTFFKYDYNSNSFTKKFDFPGGAPCFGAPVEAPNGKLYMLTVQGGTFGAGILYEYDPITSTMTVKVNLTNVIAGANFGSLALGPDGHLYGMSAFGGANFSGTIFDYVPGATLVTKRLDLSGSTGSTPWGTLILAPNNKFYGFTQSGGPSPVGGPAAGTIFEFDPASNNFVPRHSFSGQLGNSPYGTPAIHNGWLYGVTTGGGSTGVGVFFEFDLATNQYIKHVDFTQGPLGASPNGGTAFLNGKLYGTAGNSNTFTTLFEYDPATRVFSTKKQIPTESGSQSRGLVSHSNGKLYGIMAFGGANNQGSLFEYEPISNNFVVRQHFSGITGGNPGVLTVAPNGLIYGVTSSSVFQFDPSGNSYSTKFTFNPNGSEGIQPDCLIVGPDGLLYGTASFGGSTFDGVLYRIDPSSGAYTKLKDFGPADGRNPRRRPVFAPNGKLYGTTSSGGANGMGTIYEFNPSGNVFTKRYDLADAYNGIDAPLFASPTGTIIGIRGFAGANASGYVFEFDPSTGTYTNKHDLVPGSGTSPQGDWSLLKLQQSTSFGPLTGKNPGDAPFVLSGTASSGLALTYTSSEPGVATIVGNTVTLVGAGTATITATQPGNYHFTPAQPVAQVLTVTKLVQVLTFDNISPKIFGADAFNLVGASDSGLPLTFTSSDQTVATITGNTVTIVGVGSADITATQTGNNIYEAAAPIVRTLTVTKAPQVVTFAELTARTFGDAAFDVEVSSNAGLPVSLTSSDATVATVAGKTVTIVGVGTSDITATQTGSNNYEAAAPIVRTLTVTKAAQVITFAELTAKTFGDAAFDVEVSSNAGLPVSLTSSDATVATVAGKIVTIVGAGTTTITATQAGDANHLGAEAVMRTLNVSKAAQVIAFTTPGDKTLGDAAFALSGTASSGLDVSFSTLSDKVTINGSNATIVKAGRVTITGDQPGNTNYHAASSVEQSFCINPAKPVITSSGTDPVVLSSSNDAGNQWLRNETVINGATAKTLVVSEAGSFTVRTTVDDCSSASSDPRVMVVTGLESPVEPGLKLYPNPADEALFIEFVSERDEAVSVTLHDMLGREVLSRVIQSNQRVEIDLRKISSGTYLLNTTAATRRFSSRVSKR